MGKGMGWFIRLDMCSIWDSEGWRRSGSLPLLRETGALLERLEDSREQRGAALGGLRSAWS